MRGARILLECLVREGVDTIFGYPGGAVIELYDELLNFSIRHVLVRHEQGAAHAADGYARASGRVGVCFATSGPGATNLVSGIACAYMDSVPVVAFTGQVASRLLGRDAFQEADLTGITIPITKHNYLVKDVSQLPRIVREAFHIASTGRPGPVLVDLPRDVLCADGEFKPVTTVNLPGYKPTYKGHQQQIAKAAALINAARRPLAIIGGGVVSSGASKLAVALCEKANIPAVCTFMGLSGMSSDHPLNLGMLGMHGLAAANKAVQECDVLIALGTRFSDRSTGAVDKFAPNAKVIHIDIDPAEIGKNVRVDVPVVGHLAYILPVLLEMVESAEHTDWVELVNSWRNSSRRFAPGGKGAIKPQYVLERMVEKVSPQALVITDVGQHQMWVAQHWKFSWPRQLVSSGGLGIMGYGLPASVGAQIARPELDVILITGDGGFQMNMQELATVKANQLPIKVFVFNNGHLGMVRQWQNLFCSSRYSQVRLNGSPDFTIIAKAYGIEACAVEEPEQVADAIDAALKHPGPFLVDFKIEPQENVLPMVPPGKPLDEIIMD
ncbi:MAG: biosynthetic-type acetolactate synthase large subunit [Bacillota bacterium]